MSINPTPAAEQIEEHRDALEDLADSDLPINHIAETLLAIAEEEHE